MSGPVKNARVGAAFEFACAHGCGYEGTVEHADGRMLCRRCYASETEGSEAIGCPTCGGASAS